MINDELKNYYKYFEVKKGTDAFNIISLYTHGDITLSELESKLGIVSSCMDMDLYKTKSYYLVLDLKKKGTNVNIRYDLEEITFDSFLMAINEEHKHYIGVGTDNFHKLVLRPSLR